MKNSSEALNHIAIVEELETLYDLLSLVDYKRNASRFVRFDILSMFFYDVAARLDELFDLALKTPANDHANRVARAKAITRYLSKGPVRGMEVHLAAATELLAKEASRHTTSSL